MLKNIYLKTVLRDYRLSTLLWGGGLGLLIMGIVTTYDSTFSGPNREKQIEDMTKLFNAFSIIYGKVYDLGTLGGFADARVLALIPVFLSIFALMAGSGIIRGEEEKGSLDLLLSTPHSRFAVFAQKVAGLYTVLLLMAVLMLLLMKLGEVTVGKSLPIADEVLALLNVTLVPLTYVAIALMLGQLTSRRAAAGWTGGILAATYLLNYLGSNLTSLGWIRYLSPFYYYSLSKPLAISVGTNWVSMLVLAVLPLPFLVVALYMYLQRDHNDVFHLSESATTSSEITKVPMPASIWLNNLFTFGLRPMLKTALIFGAAMGAWSIMLLATFKDVRTEVVDFLNSSDLVKGVFGADTLTDTNSLLGLFLFTYIVVFAAAFVVVLISGWSSEENDGRLELVLSTPQPRWQMLAYRFVGLIIVSAVMVLVLALITWIAASGADISLNFSKFFDSFFGVWVLCVIIGAIGFIITSFTPGVAVAILGGLVGISWLAQTLGRVLKLPDWLINLSVFQHYGEPMRTGLNWSDQYIMLGLALLFVVIAAFRFTQRDLSK